MGFLKVILKYIIPNLSLLLLLGCSNPLILQDVRSNQPGHLMFGGVPSRNFYVPANIGDSLVLKWKSKTHGSFSNTSITTYDKYLFVPDLSGRIYCYDLSTGKEMGVAKNKGEISVAPALYRLRIFYLLNEYDEDYSELIYYDYFTYEIIAKNRLSGKCSNEMMMDEDGVYILSDNGRLYKFNYIGRKEWETDTGVLTMSSPAMMDKIVIFGNIKGDLIGINALDGTVRYREKISGGLASGVSISGQHGFIGDINGIVHCFKINDGSVIWKYNTGSRIKSIPVFNDSSLFIGNLKGDICALRKSSGQVLWKVNTGGLINTTPLLFNDYLVQPDLNKKVVFLDVTTGEIKKIIPFEYRMKLSPVYFNNTIFFGIDQGEIYAYDPVGR